LSPELVASLSEPQVEPLDLLWDRFRELVVATAAELEEAPARDAVDEMERRGLKLDVVARVVQQRLGQ